MKRRIRTAARLRFGLWTLAGIASIGLFPAIERYELKRFASEEAYFASPVPVVRGGVAIRNDDNAGGRFGDSRGGGRRRHQGIDLVSAPDTPVFASKSGRVIRAGLYGGYGNFVALLHPDGWRTHYAHLNAIAVEDGQWVDRGLAIGTSGRTGNADSPDIVPHLHFEIRDDSSKPLDPAKGLLEPSLTLR